jgi:hypothetical protein
MLMQVVLTDEEASLIVESLKRTRADYYNLYIEYGDEEYAEKRGKMGVIMERLKEK